MPVTYEPINTTTLASSVTDITFSSIPNTYTDLILVTSVFGSRAANVDSLAVRFNGDTASNYSYTYFIGESSAGAISSSAANQTNIWVGNFTSNSVTQPGAIVIQIQNYSNTTTNKTILSRQNAMAGGTYNITGANVGLWRSTSAITSVTVRSETGSNFSSGSTFTLYGIKAA